MAREPELQAAQLYLITPPVSDASAFEQPLRDALSKGPVACVLLRLNVRDAGDAKKILRHLAPLIQDSGAALLVENDAQLATRAGTDGAHMSGQMAGDTETLAAAIASLKPDRIVGAAAAASRDTCMVMGEMDIDYLMFGGPDENIAQDAITEQAQWWAEIFNVPCVGYAQTLDAVAAIARAGAEFVALEQAVWNYAAGPAAAIAIAAAHCADNKR